jgi:hypothetical protein
MLYWYVGGIFTFCLPGHDLCLLTPRKAEVVPEPAASGSAAPPSAAPAAARLRAAVGLHDTSIGWKT